MSYVLRIFRGDDPASPPPSLRRVEVMAALGGLGRGTSEAPDGGGRRFHAEGLKVDVELAREDPAREVCLTVGWSTADELGECLDYAIRLAGALGARVYDKNADRFLGRDRVEALRAAGGFSPATPGRARRWWWPFG